MLLNFLVGSQIESTSEELQLLVRQHLIEEQITSVVLVCLHLALGVLCCNRLIEEFDQHGEVVCIQRLQSLLFFHLLVIKDIANVFIAEEVV